MVNFGGEKMSKSLGNVVSIRRVAETHDLEALRLLFVSAHYRSPVSFEVAQGRPTGGTTFPDLDEAEERLDYFYRTLERIDAAGVPAGAAGARPGGAARGADRGGLSRGDGRRLQQRGRARAPLRVVRAGQQAARRAEGGAEGRPRADPGQLRDDLRSCGATLGISGACPRSS